MRFLYKLKTYSADFFCQASKKRRRSGHSDVDIGFAKRDYITIQKMKHGVHNDAQVPFLPSLPPQLPSLLTSSSFSSLALKNMQLLKAPSSLCTSFQSSKTLSKAGEFPYSLLGLVLYSFLKSQE